MLCSFPIMAIELLKLHNFLDGVPQDGLALEPRLSVLDFVSELVLQLTSPFPFYLTAELR